VINAPLGNVRSTAEHTMALIFALARRVVAADRAVRDGRWKTGYEGMQLGGKRLGVIGAGKVGNLVALLAAGMGMEVVAYDPYLPEEAWAERTVLRVELPELLATSDVVTLHVPLTRETRRLIGAHELALMQPHAVLVNTARGGVVDLDALLAALRRRQLAGAALDVLPHEPPPLVPQAPNLIVTPHAAWYSEAAQARAYAGAIAAVRAVLAGEEPPNAVVRP
jgi:D-3-phosphoglycerate dehydrogenase